MLLDNGTPTKRHVADCPQFPQDVQTCWRQYLWRFRGFRAYVWYNTHFLHLNPLCWLVPRATKRATENYLRLNQWLTTENYLRLNGWEYQLSKPLTARRHCWLNQCLTTPISWTSRMVGRRSRKASDQHRNRSRWNGKYQLMMCWRFILTAQKTARSWSMWIWWCAYAESTCHEIGLH